MQALDRLYDKGKEELQKDLGAVKQDARTLWERMRWINLDLRLLEDLLSQAAPVPLARSTDEKVRTASLLASSRNDMVLLLANHDYQYGKEGSRFHRRNGVQVTVTMPGWFTPRDLIEVAGGRIERRDYEVDGRTVKFTLPHVDVTRQLVLTSDEHRFAALNQKLFHVMVPIERANRAIKADGELSDWAGTAPLVLDANCARPGHGGSAKPSKDLSASLRFAWDSGHFYLAATVTDDEKFMSQDGWRHFADAKKADGFNYISSPSPHPKGDYKSCWTDRFICYPTAEDQVCGIAGRCGGDRDLVAKLEGVVKNKGHGLVQSYGMDDLQPGQVAIAMALGKIDAWQAHEADWFRYLNLGFPSCVGTGSDYYFTYGLVRNMAREYSRMDELTWGNMVGAYKRHATFLTSGPLVAFKVNGRQVGDVVLSGPKEKELHVSIAVWNVRGLKDVELIGRAAIVKTFRYGDAPRQVDEECKLQTTQTSWYLLRVRGADGTSAITSPIYVQFGDDPLEAKQEDVRHFLKHIEAYRVYLREAPPHHKNTEKELGDADKAEAAYRALLARPRTWLMAGREE